MLWYLFVLLCPALVGPGWPEKLGVELWAGCQGGLTAEPRGRQPVPACFLAPAANIIWEEKNNYR